MPTTDNARTVRVTGRGEVTLAPDIGEFVAGVDVTDISTEVALRKSNETIKQVAAALLEFGIAEDDVTLGWFSVRTVYDRVDGRQILRGYQVSHELTVTIRDIDRTGAALTTAIRSGATGLRQLRFDVEDPSPGLDRARERAFTDARHKAEMLAQLAGLSLGPVSSISETSTTPVAIERRDALMAYAEVGSPSDVPINPEGSQLSVNLEAVWDLK